MNLHFSLDKKLNSSLWLRTYRLNWNAFISKRTIVRKCTSCNFGLVGLATACGHKHILSGIKTMTPSAQSFKRQYALNTYPQKSKVNPCSLCFNLFSKILVIVMNQITINLNICFIKLRIPVCTHIKQITNQPSDK